MTCPECAKTYEMGRRDGRLVLEGDLYRSRQESYYWLGTRITDLNEEALRKALEATLDILQEKGWTTPESKSSRACSECGEPFREDSQGGLCFKCNEKKETASYGNLISFEDTEVVESAHLGGLGDHTLRHKDGGIVLASIDFRDANYSLAGVSKRKIPERIHEILYQKYVGSFKKDDPPLDDEWHAATCTCPTCRCVRSATGSHNYVDASTQDDVAKNHIVHVCQLCSQRRRRTRVQMGG